MAPTVAVADAPAELVIDGALDEAAWAGAEPVTSFSRFQPTEGGAPPGSTEVRFLQDEHALYVGIRVRDAGYAIRARVSPREDINSDDQVGVYLDTFDDGRSGYVFYLNPLGIQQDARANGYDWSFSWDTALRSAGVVDPDGEGYTIELAIPWRSVKYRAGAGDQTWGVILTRKIPGEGAKYGFPTLENNHPALFQQAAELVGVDPPATGSGLELVPSLTVAQQWGPTTNPDFAALDVDPWTDAVRPSLDGRFGLAPDLGFAATVNPDFSQVESDVADVRLNALFAFQFPEKRPFFLDGIDAYQDRQRTLYTRSIGDPFYGVKVTGRQERTTVGVVNAVDRRPTPSVHEDGTPGFGEAQVAGAVASDTFGRVGVDVGEAGEVGVVVADKRLVPGDGSAGAAYDGLGLDATVPIGGRWVAGGSVGGSAVVAPADALYGWSAEGSLARTTGVGTGLYVEGRASSRDFRQEMGFLTQSGLVEGEVELDHTFAPAGGPLDTVVPNVGAFAKQEDDGDFVRSAWVGSAIRGGAHHVWTFAEVIDQGYAGAEVPGYTVEAGGGTELGAALELYPAAGFGRTLDYGTLGPADYAWAELQASVRATVATRLDLTASASRHLPEGEALETASLARARFTWQFTRPLGARVIVQHDRIDVALDPSRNLELSGLLSFLTVPGTAAYVGWTERVDLRVGETSERIVFAKASVLFRP